jgi:hypothetical protein
MPTGDITCGVNIEKTRGERKMKNKLVVSMLLILVLATIPIALRVEHVYANPSGPSLVVNDLINRVNATLGIKAGSKVTAYGVITNVGATPLNQLLTGVFFAEGTGVAVPGDFSFEFSLDCVTWFPIHPSEVKVAAPWTGYQVELVIGQAGGESLNPGSSSQMYLKMTVINDLTTVYGGALGLLQSMCVAVFKDANGNRHLDAGELIYTQPPMYGGVIGWDNPIRVDLAIVHTAEIEGTGEFYYSIQDAVDAASSTIILYPGIYAPFTVSGNSSLTIVANGAVVVKGSQSVATHYGNRDAVIFVTGSTDITLDGLDIEGQGLGTTNPKSYAVIYESSSGTIKDCVVSPNTIGNVNGVGIAAWDHSDLVIDPCIIKNFGRIGVFFYDGCTGGVYDSTIEGQVYNDENLVNYGIEIETYDYACDIEIIGNEIYDCDNTYLSPKWSSAGIVIDGWLGIYYIPSSTVVISNNDIHDNYYGIEVVANPYSYAHYNNIYNNREYGVIEDSDYLGKDVTFDARYNWWGDSSGPYHTTLNPSGLGNAVSDYVDFDPWLVHDVAIINVVPSSTMVIVGNTVQINVTARNEGTYYENFTVTLSYDGTPIDTADIKDLAPGATKLLTFSWDTTGVTPYGDYTIKAEASTVPGETDVADNVKTAMVRIGTAPTIKVEQPINNAQMLNKTFNINITMNDLGQYWRVIGVQFRLQYNDTLLEVVNVTEGPFMKQAGTTFFICFVEEDPLYGPNVLVGIIVKPNAAGQWNVFPSGSGILTTITFKTIYQERGLEKPPLTCDLKLNETLIICDDGTKTPHNLQNGIYKIYPTHIGDINYDGKVDMIDMWRVAKAYGSLPGHERWNPECDTDNNGKIDMRDMYFVAKGFGWIPTYDP